ncbi:hypothetical protein KCA24_36460, partial [Escherichia coli]|nr:hypothetical protein [Escherichia coli]
PPGRKTLRGAPFKNFKLGAFRPKFHTEFYNEKVACHPALTLLVKTNKLNHNQRIGLQIIHMLNEHKVQNV